MSAAERVTSPGRERLARDGVLGGIAFAMGVLLTLALPTKAEFDAQTESLPLSAYSEAYLSVLTKAHPADAATRLAWVKQLAGRGDYQSALRELALVPRRAPWSETADQLGFDLAWTQVQVAPAGSEERRAALAAVGTRLEALLAGRPRLPRWQELARIALAIERPELAARCYEGIAGVSDGPARRDALVEAGRWRLAIGDFAAATGAFEEAARLATDEAEVTALIGRALDAQLARGEARAALTTALRWLPRRPGDRVLLRRASELAAASDDAKMARDLGRQLLALSPEDGDEQERQVQRELAAGDSRAAWPLIEAAVRRHPKSVEWRRREAEVAEWTGRPRVALRDWLILSEVGVPSPASARAMRPQP